QYKPQPDLISRRAPLILVREATSAVGWKFHDEAVLYSTVRFIVTPADFQRSERVSVDWDVPSATSEEQAWSIGMAQFRNSLDRRVGQGEAIDHIDTPQVHFVAPPPSPAPIHAAGWYLTVSYSYSGVDDDGGFGNVSTALPEAQIPVDWNPLAPKSVLQSEA